MLLPPMAWAFIRAQPWPKGLASTLAARRARRRSPHLPGGGIRLVHRLSPGHRATLRTLRYSGAVVGMHPNDQCTVGGTAPPVNPTAYRLPSKTCAPTMGVKRTHQTPSFIIRTLQKVAVVKQHHTSFVNKICSRQQQHACKEMHASQQLCKYPATTPDINMIPATLPAIPNGGGATGWFPVSWDFVSWCPAGQLPAGWYPVDVHPALDRHTSDVVTADGETSSGTSSKYPHGQSANEGIATQAHSHFRNRPHVCHTG
ncbi:hypothetical protein GGI13_003660 [Coemansia sp. RSA 455]|nr:hypothetical protein GGI13_003660 [Coemansia sp. RSA 455]